MQAGDFTQLSPNGTPIIFDPTTSSCTASGCTRQPFMGVKNGVATTNVIPANEISPIAQYMQKFLPAPTNNQLENNFLGGVPSGYDNWEFLTKLDYDLTSSQRLSFIMTLGSRKNVPFTVGNNGVVLPLPYTNGGYATITPRIFNIEHSIVITPHIVNQFKFGFTRFAQPVENLTDGISPYQAVKDIGITNLPPGQASDEFPGVSFAASKAFPTVQGTWTSNGASGATHTVVPNAFTYVDNLQITKGRHAMTIGIQTQWLQDNVASQSGPSGVFTTAFSANDTANFSGSSLNGATTGYSYASFLMGAVNSSNTAIQPFSETGGRYHPVSPYFQDNWKIRTNLTLSLGLRYDYLPPFHEVLDRWSYLNPALINPATGNPGRLEFAGHRGADISCNCRTPVHTYWKNWGPRLGFAYSRNPKTVISGGFAIVYSRAGGVGGRAGDATGTGQAGFTSNLILPAASTTGISAGPSYYLNNSASFQAKGLANTAFGGPGFTLPTPMQPDASALIVGTGNYINSTGAYQSPGSAPGYADPYLSGRAPEINFFNFGVQRAITDNLTLRVNYAGTEAHFLSTGSNARGYWADQLNPAYVAALGSAVASDGKTPLLNAPATSANVAIAQAAMPGLSAPYPAYTSAAAKNSGASIARMLTAFPQYSGVSDTWGNVGNVSYHSLQITLNQRAWKGLSYTLNYTYSKNLGDDNTFRSGFDIPAAAMSNGVAYHQGKADRSYTTVAVPQDLAAYGVYKLPFGPGGIGGDNFWVRTLAGGWQLSSIYTYLSGTPLAITYGGCTAPLQGQCMPDLNPSFQGPARINGSWGKHITAANLGAIHYIDQNAFSVPNSYPTTASTEITKIGDAPRTRALNLSNPSKYNIDASVQRSFNIIQERVKFIFQADCLNVTNKVTFGGIQTAWSPSSTSSFGSVGSASGNRDFQFSGRIVF